MSIWLFTPLMRPVSPIIIFPLKIPLTLNTPHCLLCFLYLLSSMFLLIWKWGSIYTEMLEFWIFLANLLLLIQHELNPLRVTYWFCRWRTGSWIYTALIWNISYSLFVHSLKWLLKLWCSGSLKCGSTLLYLSLSWAVFLLCVGLGTVIWVIYFSTRPWTYGHWLLTRGREPRVGVIGDPHR